MWLAIVVVVTKIKKSVEVDLLEHRQLRGLPLSTTFVLLIHFHRLHQNPPFFKLRDVLSTIDVRS